MERATVLTNEKLGPGLYRLLLKVDPGLARKFLPGQFLKLKVSPTLDPLIPRPFTVHTKEEETLEVLYQVVGRGTRLLTKLAVGEEIFLAGPMGNPFPKLSVPYLICAGGIGVAGFGLLLQEAPQNYPKPEKLLYGARSKAHLLKLDFFSGYLSVEVATDDGSLGYKGTVVDLLKEELRKDRYGALLACGPKVMLKRVAEVAQAFGVKAYLLLETFLACGTGYCLGCAIPKKGGGYYKLCLDGPTFLAEELDLAFLF